MRQKRTPPPPPTTTTNTELQNRSHQWVALGQEARKGEHGGVAGWAGSLHPGPEEAMSGRRNEKQRRVIVRFGLDERTKREVSWRKRRDEGDERRGSERVKQSPILSSERTA